MEVAMELPCTVKVLEECQISPPSGSVPPTSLPLCSFDLAFLRSAPVQRLFFYEFKYPQTHFINTILPNIKQSLSLTLQRFYPLAGKLTWPHESFKPEIVYMDDDAVSLTVAESDYDFYQLAGSQPQDWIECYPLIPKFQLATSGEKRLPLLAVQATIFPNKGICIGITTSHVGCDGRASSQFIRFWASICKFQGDMSLITDSLPVFDKPTLKDQEQNEKLFMNEMAKVYVTKETFDVFMNDRSLPTDMVRASFAMGRSDITKLKQWISTRLETQNDMHLSSFVVGLAYIWVCLVKARWGETDTSEATEYLMIPADARARIDPPLPVTYFGNCMCAIDVMAKRSDLIGKEGIAIAAQSIGRAIKNLDLNDQKGLSHRMSLPPEQVFTINSSPKFRFYEADFGWGKPKKIEMSASRSGQSITVTECPSEEGALEFGVLRNKIYIDALVRLFANSLDDLS